ncbi:unnamed protein product [Rotaria magnacalcarata]
MTSLPTNRIVDLRNEIHKNLPQVHANKVQCERLCQRIDQLIEPIERLEHATSLIVREETRPILDRLLQCVDDCNQYIEKLKTPEEWYEEVYEYKRSDETFKELNKRLSQIGQDLSLGLNIQELFDRKQDEEDRQKDLKDLNKKLDEISQKMLEKQCEQYKLIDKMIDRRFQSFRFYLAQNLLMQQDFNQSQELQEKYQYFLHIPYKDLYIEEKLVGSGGFADVYKAHWLTHHDQVAVKMIRINNLSNIENDFYREISTMYRIRYENILSVFGACVEPNLYAIVVEYMPLGSLYDVLHKKREQISLDWLDRYSIAWQMTKSINYLHNLNPMILHRDIKSMNFLLKYNGPSNQKYLVKVCDFGLAEIRRETLLQSAAFPSLQLVGSFYWKAPELFTPHSRYTKQSDIYSLGVVFWELATARIPWDEYEDATIVLVQLKTGERPTIPSDVPELYKSVIHDAWHQNPQKRPTCFQLMERLHKQLDQIESSTIVTTEKTIIDLHSPETEIEQPTDALNSIGHTDSTVTAIQVADEENEEKSLANNLPTVVMTESFHIETQIADETLVKPTKPIESELPLELNRLSSSSNKTESQSQTVLSVENKVESEPSPPERSASFSTENMTEEQNQTEFESTQQPSAPSSSIHTKEEQNQAASSSTVNTEEKSFKTTQGLTANSSTYNPPYYPFDGAFGPIYRLEKRRPLHGNSK